MTNASDGTGRRPPSAIDATLRRADEQALTFLAQYVEIPGKEDFFHALARFIATTLDLGFVCIDRLDGDGLTAHTVAVFSDGDFTDNVSYALKDTPCGTVVGEHVCCFPSGVRQLFPRDAVLQDMAAECYVGVTLRSHHGQPIGLIAVIGKRPLADRHLAESLLRLVAVRAGGEMERLQVEAALRESQERMQYALGMNQIGAWDLDLRDHSAFRTIEHDRIFGYDTMLPQWTYAMFLDHVLPEDRAEVDRRFQLAMREHGDWSFECRIVRRDGAQRWIAARGQHRRDAEGRYRRLAGIVQDITERKLAEQSLEGSRQRLALAADSAGFGIWDWDVRHDRILWDAQMHRLYGLDPQTEDGTVATWKQRLHPDDAESAFAEVAAALLGTRTYDSEFRVRHPDGTIRHIKADGVVVRDADGTATRMLGVNYDITERKAMEQRLRDSEYFFKESQRAASIGSYHLSFATGRWQSSEILDDIFGIGPDYPRDIQGWLGLVHPDHREMMASYMADEVIAKRRPFAKEYMMLRRSDGATRWVDGRGKVILDAGGTLVSMIGTIQDITERKQMEERLRQTEKLSSLGQLAGGIAHDFNNQLGGIMGYAEMLANRADNPVLQRYAAQILAASHRAADLTRELLAFARKGQYLKVPVDMHAVIAETVSLLQRSIDRRIHIDQRLTSQSPMVLGDPTQLQNALLNLALNARDAMPEGGTLTFATGHERIAPGGKGPPGADLQPGDYLQVQVGDTGLGMSAEVKSHLFEPFFTTKGPGKGTGMGLAAVYGTVRKHDGAIVVTSEAGQGTTIQLLLPLTGNHQLPDAAIPAGPSRLRHLRILVVDDEPVMRGVLAELLAHEGHEVVQAGNGREGIAAYRDLGGRFDLVILDMVMPEMNGRDCFRAMRAINPGIRALLASGFSLDNEARTILDEGVRGFIQKPFLRDELVAQMTAALEG